MTDPGSIFSPVVIAVLSDETNETCFPVRGGVGPAANWAFFVGSRKASWRQPVLNQREKLIEYNELQFEFHCINEWMDGHFQCEHVVIIDRNKRHIKEDSSDLSKDEQLHNSKSLGGVSVFEKFAGACRYRAAI